MASGVGFGARFCCRAYASSSCFSRASRITFNTSRYLWRCRQASVVNTVSTKRFYADEKPSRVSDVFPPLQFSQYLKPETFTDAAADTDSSAALEGEQEDEDPSMQMMVERYEKYRIWIAKLMGKDPESFSPEDVQEAVEYLMPSGLYAKDCRPKFEHPKTLYRQSKAQSMDEHGRPLAAAFYTGQVGFHDLLFEIYEETAKLNAIAEQKDLEEAESSDSDTTAAENNSASSDDSESHSSDSESSDGNDKKKSKENWSQQKMKWISKLEMEREISELLSDRDYEVILHRLKKLTKHRHAYHATPFLLRFLKAIPLPGGEETEKKLNEEGEAYAEGDRKNAVARVWVKRGTGNVTVNDVAFVKYFARMEDRKQIMSPFLAINAVGEYDVKSEVIGGGHSGQSGAIRLAISRALLNFEDSYLEPLLEARLLIRDPRIKERKKPGQKRARKKFAWLRR